MKAARITVLAALIVSAGSAFAGLTSGKENCQAQAAGSFNDKQKHERTAEALRVVDGAAKAAPKPQRQDSKAISEKGS